MCEGEGVGLSYTIHCVDNVVESNNVRVYDFRKDVDFFSYVCEGIVICQLEFIVYFHCYFLVRDFVHC